MLLKKRLSTATGRSLLLHLRYSRLMATMKLELSVRIPIIFLNSKIKKIETKRNTCQLLVLYQEGEEAVRREIIL